MECQYMTNVFRGKTDLKCGTDKRFLQQTVLHINVGKTSTSIKKARFT